MSKVCKNCHRKRAERFFSSKRALYCDDCKRSKAYQARRTRPGLMKKKAWKAFSDFIRIRDSLSTTGTYQYCRCITCNNVVPYREIQAGHFVSGRGGAVLFDEELVYGQCQTCNMFKNGMYEEYTLEMLSRYGRDRVENMLRRKHKTVKHDYQEIIDKYKDKVKKIKKMILTKGTQCGIHDV